VTRGSGRDGIDEEFKAWNRFPIHGNLRKVSSMRVLLYSIDTFPIAFVGFGFHMSATLSVCGWLPVVVTVAPASVQGSVYGSRFGVLGFSLPFLEAEGP
jgi:hypothetical protein